MIDHVMLLYLVMFESDIERSDCSADKFEVLERTDYSAEMNLFATHNCESNKMRRTSKTFFEFL